MYIKHHDIDDSMRYFAKGDQPPATINVWTHDSGLLTSHDQPCYVCHERPAIHDRVQREFGGPFVGTFQPCSACQKMGWRLARTIPTPWWAFWKFFKKT